MATTVTFTTPTDTVVITGTEVYDGPTYDKLDGWYGVDADSRFEKRPSAPGSFAPVRTYANARPISVEGQYFGSSRADSLAMRERLLGLYADGVPITMTVADDLRTTSREVHVVTVTVPWTIRAEFAFAIDVEAADPRRFAPAGDDSTGLIAAGGGLEFPLVFPLDFGELGSDGRALSVNGGTTASASRFVVGGGTMLDGFELVNVTTGQRIVYLGPVAGGDSTIVIDARLRAAFINDTAPASRFLQDPQWWEVPAASTVAVQFLARGVVTGAPTLTVTTSPAFY